MKDRDTMIGRDDILRCAIAEYHMDVRTEDGDARVARRSAVRGLMVRLGLYGDFVSALLREAERSGGEASVLVSAALVSEVREQLGEPEPSPPDMEASVEGVLGAARADPPSGAIIPGGDCRVDARATKLAMMARDLRLCADAADGTVPEATRDTVRSAADELVAMAVLFQQRDG